MATAARCVEVEKTYQVGAVEVPAVRGISLDIQEGDFMAIAGPSGSGKTTLLNLLGALDTPTAGSIEVGELCTEGMNRRELADFRNTNLGFIFQTFNLIPVLTVRENVEFPLQLQGLSDAAERRERVLALLEVVGLGSMVDRRPSELSGGQQQRVAIARALVKEPRLVLADEPTANLDSGTSTEIILLMQEMNARLGSTFVFSTHDPLVMDHALRLVRLRDGKVESDERKGGDGGAA